MIEDHFGMHLVVIPYCMTDILAKECKKWKIYCLSTRHCRCSAHRALPLLPFHNAVAYSVSMTPKQYLSNLSTLVLTIAQYMSTSTLHGALPLLPFHNAIAYSVSMTPKQYLCNLSTLVLTLAQLQSSKL